MEATQIEQVLRAGPLEIRPEWSMAWAEGRPLVLSTHEFELLVAMASRPDRVLSREDLYEWAWDRRLRADDRSVDVYVRKLRRKLGAAVPGWAFIHTHHGMGYRFAAEPRERQDTNTTRGN